MNDKIRMYHKPDEINVDTIRKLFENGSEDQNWIWKEIKNYSTGAVDEIFIYNSDNVHVGIRTGNGAKIELNPNKILCNKPAQDGVLSYKEIKQTIEQANEELIETGFDCPNLLTSGKLFSYHNSFDIETDYPYSNYEPMFKMLGGAMTNPAARRYKDIKGTQYYSTSTGNTVVTIYDKTAESELLFNCIRHEIRHERLSKKIPMSAVNERFYLQSRQKDHARIMDMFYNGFDKTFLGSPWSYLVQAAANGTLTKKTLSEMMYIQIAQDRTQMDVIKVIHRNARGNAKRNCRYILQALKPWQTFTDNTLSERYNELKTKFGRGV